MFYKLSNKNIFDRDAGYSKVTKYIVDKAIEREAKQMNGTTELSTANGNWKF